jgi:hypothetical protein
MVARAADEGAQMSNDRTPEKAARAAGFSVHLFTACGAAVAVLALYAAIERDFPAASPGSVSPSSSTGLTAPLRAPPRCR